MSCAPWCAKLSTLSWRTACCECDTVEVLYWHLAEHFYRGQGLPENPLAPFWGVILSDPLACPLATALAYTLTAEFAVWLSRIIWTVIPSDLGKQTYQREVARYVQGCAWRAIEWMALALPKGGFDEVQTWGAPMADMLEVLLEDRVSFDTVMRRGRRRSGQGGNIFYETVLFAAVGDSQWWEIFVPAVFSEDVSFWMAPTINGFSKGWAPHLKRLPTKIVVDLQERAMQIVLHKVLDELAVMKRQNDINAFWVESSTLIALLRYGRLIGSFRDGNLDCVDDDLDFVVGLSNDTENASEALRMWGPWVHFTRSMSAALAGHNASCYLAGNMKTSVKTSTLDEHSFFSFLLCIFEFYDFTVPVSFRFNYNNSQPLGRCSGYGREVPCPSDLNRQFGKYKGCTAIPNLEFAALTAGNQCVEWMEGGFKGIHVAELRAVAENLDMEGFLSMGPLWSSDECSGFANVDPSERVPVGKLARRFNIEKAAQKEVDKLWDYIDSRLEDFAENVNSSFWSAPAN